MIPSSKYPYDSIWRTIRGASYVPLDPNTNVLCNNLQEAIEKVGSVSEGKMPYACFPLALPSLPTVFPRERFDALGFFSNDPNRIERDIKEILLNNSWVKKSLSTEQETKIDQFKTEIIPSLIAVVQELNQQTTTHKIVNLSVKSAWNNEQLLVIDNQYHQDGEQGFPQGFRWLVTLIGPSTQMPDIDPELPVRYIGNDPRWVHDEASIDTEIKAGRLKLFSPPTGYCIIFPSEGSARALHRSPSHQGHRLFITGTLGLQDKKTTSE